MRTMKMRRTHTQHSDMYTPELLHIYALYAYILGSYALFSRIVIRAKKKRSWNPETETERS